MDILQSVRFQVWLKITDKYIWTSLTKKLLEQLVKTHQRLYIRPVSDKDNHFYYDVESDTIVNPPQEKYIDAPIASVFNNSRP